MELNNKNARHYEDARRRRLLRLMDEIESETTDEHRAATRATEDEMYDDSGLPARSSAPGPMLR